MRSRVQFAEPNDRRCFLNANSFELDSSMTFSGKARHQWGNGVGLGTRRATDKVPIDQNVIFSRMKWFSPMIDSKDLDWFIVSLIDKISDWELCGMPEADSKLPLCRTISSLDIVDHLERSDWAKWDCLKSWYTKSRNCSSQDSWRLAYPTPLDCWTLSCQDSGK